jgi:hypothetical protein
MTAEPTSPTTFRAFWPYYLDQHRHPGCRALHYVGTSAGVLLALGALAQGSPVLLAVALLAGYGPAWIGHFLIEHNRPATLRHPLWSFAADFKMLALAATGRLDQELITLPRR